MGRKVPFKRRSSVMAVRKRVSRIANAVKTQKLQQMRDSAGQQWLSCQTDVNKLIKRDESIDLPLFSKEESAWAADVSDDGTTYTKDNVLSTEQIKLEIEEIRPDTKDITLAEPIDGIDEEFKLEEEQEHKNDVDENKDELRTDWVIQKLLCRCCHAEGDFTTVLMETSEDNLSYDDMLLSCFNIQLHPVEGAGAEVLRGLCALCSARLRDAHAFSRQVRAADTRFQHLYTNNCITVAGAIEMEVKEEIPYEDDEHDEQINEQNEIKQKEKKAKAPTKPPKKSAPRIKHVWPQYFCTRVDDSYKCTGCKEVYTCQGDFTRHYRKTHMTKVTYKCSICQDRFKTETQRKKHKLEEHNIDERHNCNACDKKFNLKCQLKLHEKAYHMLGERIKCSKCDYETYDKCALGKHMVKHITTKDYQCKFCKKAFLRKTNLRLHERIHTGDKRKACAECGQAFVQKASLNYHMTKYHPGVSF